MGKRLTQFGGKEIFEAYFSIYLKFNREASAGVDQKINAGCFVDTGVTNDDPSFTMVNTLFS
jgi:hypothetical protein